jgi:hydroxymethylpyrimidine pyrophosphatase-like HAD family hydrolase
MGNAQVQVKKVANHITLNNDQDGIAKVIEELGLI